MCLIMYSTCVCECIGLYVDVCVCVNVCNNDTLHLVDILWASLDKRSQEDGVERLTDLILPPEIRYLV